MEIVTEAAEGEDVFINEGQCKDVEYDVTERSIFLDLGMRLFFCYLHSISLFAFPPFNGSMIW